MFKSIIEILSERATDKNSIAFTFLDDLNKTSTLTYFELHEEATRISNYLQPLVNPGDAIVLLLPQGLDYIKAFFGCLYRGALAVPLYPATGKGQDERILNVVNNCGARAALTNAAFMKSIQENSEISQCLSLIAIESIPTHVIDQDIVLPLEQSLAFLQYTSGSTGTPKGVMVSHANIIANLQALVEATQCTKEDVFCNWLPFFHDLGLVNTILLPIYIGAHSVLMSTYRFIRNPIRWLESISEYRASICGAPNFAYDLCLERISSSDATMLDLSSWRVAFNAAEPINADSLDLFMQRFSAAGFSKTAFYPSYGMAEATVFISGGQAGSPVVQLTVSKSALQIGEVLLQPDQSDAQRLIGCGMVQSKHDVKIVDPKTKKVLSDGAVGEIWVSGPSIAGGYWGDDEKTRSVFNSSLFDSNHRYLRTGDLGFICDNQLYVSGRIKDVIIVKGRNYYPQDLELICSQSYKGLRKGGSAAFELDGKVVLIQEVSRIGISNFNYSSAIDCISSNIFEKLEVLIEDIVFIKSGQLPRTSSGKIQRAAAKQHYVSGTFKKLDFYYDKKSNNFEKISEGKTFPVNEREQLLCGIWQDVLGLEKVYTNDSFFKIGGDSLTILKFINKAKEYNLNYTTTQIFKCRTVQALADLSVDVSPVMESVAFSSDIPLFVDQINFFNRVLVDPNRGNASLLLYVDSNFNVDLWLVALKMLCTHHDMLRAKYEQYDGKWKQTIMSPDDINIPFEYIDYSLLSQSEKIAETYKHVMESLGGFDLNCAPLIKTWIYDHGSEVGRVLRIMVHHLVADGYSIRVLINDHLDCYHALLSNKPFTFPPKTSSVNQWANAVIKYVNSDAMQNDIAYWNNVQPFTVARLPLDYPANEHLNSYHGYTSIAQVLSGKQIQRLNALVIEHEIPLINIFIGVLSHIIAQYTLSKSVLLAVIDSGRGLNFDIDVDLSRTIGWLSFNRLLPIEVCGEEYSLPEKIQHIHHQIQNIPNKGLGYELLKNMADNESILQKMPDAEVWLNFHGQEDHTDKYDFFNRLYPIGNQMSWVHPDNQRPYKLFFNMTLMNGSLIVDCEYNTNLHSAETIAGLIEQFFSILTAISDLKLIA